MHIRIHAYVHASTEPRYITVRRGLALAVHIHAHAHAHVSGGSGSGRLRRRRQFASAERFYPNKRDELVWVSDITLHVCETTIMYTVFSNETLPTHDPVGHAE